MEVAYVTRPLDFGPHVWGVEIVRTAGFSGLRRPGDSSASAFNAAWQFCLRRHARLLMGRVPKDAPRRPRRRGGSYPLGIFLFVPPTPHDMWAPGPPVMVWVA